MKKIVWAASGIVIVGVLLIVIFSGRGKRIEHQSQTATAQKVIELSSLTPTPTRVQPTATPTLTPTPTVLPTNTLTPTPRIEAVRIVTFDAVYNESSQFTLEMTGQLGEYYGTARVQDGDLFQYKCEFHQTIANRLVCAGGPLPLYSKINFQLYRRETGELLFNQEVIYDFALHGEVIPSPTGVYCEVIPIHLENETEQQKETGCFNVTCWQNGEPLWETDNSCGVDWPFLWDYSHPMHDPSKK